MPIVASDIKIMLTVTTGSAGKSSASSGPASLGKWISTTPHPSGKNLFAPRLSGAENAGLVQKWRCLAVENTHPTNTALDVRAWLKGGDPAGGRAWAVAVDPTAASPVGSSTPQGLTAASDTAPGSAVTSLAYSTPTAATSGVSLGDIPPGYCRFVWVRESAQNNAAMEETVPLTFTLGTLG